MRSVQVAITANSQSLFDIGGFTDAPCNEVLLQAPTANGAVINFGAHGHELGILVNGATAGLAITSLRNVYVKGTPSDTLVILVF